MTFLQFPGPGSYSTRAGVLAIAARILACAGALGAQEQHRADAASRAVAHVQLGSYLPVGALRRGFGPAILVGVQGNVRLARNLGAVATLSGSQVRDEREIGRPEWYLWQYDAGLELSSGHGGRLRHPAFFAGGGVGGRTYNRIGPDQGVRSALAAYAAAGAEVRSGRAGFRLESRLYLSRPGGQLDGDAMRADAAVTAGLAYHFR